MRDPTRLPSLLFAVGTLGLIRIGPYGYGVPGWLVMLLLLLPLGLWVGGGWMQRGGRKFKLAGCLLYALLFAWLTVHALSWRPPGWPLWLFLAALGMAPAVVTVVERR